jgi:multiple sugar transport system permease protein
MRPSRSVTEEHRRSARLGATVLVAVAAIGFVLPMVWLFSTSLKTKDEVFTYPPQVIPPDPQWSNYTDIWTQYPLAQWLVNSIFISAAIVVGQCLTSSLAGFAFARLRFPGRDKVFFLYLAGMLIPSQVLLIPIFVLVSRLGWVNTPWGLIVPALAGPFGTFLYRQFYLSISQEYVDAAQLDGASMLRIWWGIFVPLSKGLTAAFAAITFLASWNSFIWPLVLLRTPEKFTATLGLASIAGADQFRVPWQLVMATSVTMLVPVLILFAVAQRHLVRGVAMSGYTGK